MATNSTATLTFIPLPLHKRNGKNSISTLWIFIIFILLFLCSAVFYITETKGVGFLIMEFTRAASIKTFNTSESKKYVDVFTESKSQAINQLRNATQMYFTKPFMTEDFYLAKWLNENDWDITDAQEMLLEHFEWRSENNIDNILQEDFSFWEAELPYYTDGVDFVGRPVCSADVSMWDIRKIVASGQSDKMLRYGHYQIEKAIQLILNARDEGKNVSSLIEVVNLNKFNLAQHACFSCLKFLMEYLFDIADHYPGWLHRIIVINTPDMFETVLSMAAPFARGEHKEALMIFGKDEKQWKDEVFSLIPKNQLRVQFGGTKSDDLD